MIYKRVGTFFSLEVKKTDFLYNTLKITREIFKKATRTARK